MADDRDAEAGIDTGRCLNRARAALREAAEHLEDAAAASEHPNVSLAAALSHVGAARRAIRPHGVGVDRNASEVNAA